MDYQEYVRYEPFLARRAWAAILDYLLYLGIFIGYVFFFGTPNAEGMLEAKGIQHVFGVVILWILYFPGMEGMFGFTLFKGLFDLKIAPERRKDARFVVAFKRHLLDPIDFFVFGIVAIILVKTREDHKRLGDMLAHSRVVLDKKA
jgi:uncharacterized RDD family membrane protein YckC